MSLGSSSATGAVGSSAELAAAHDEFVRAVLAEVGLSVPEALAVCDACNGVIVAGGGWRWLWADVADADRLCGLGRKWDVDAQALAGRLRDLPLGAKYALAVAVRRFWTDSELNSVPDTALLRRVGLVTESQGD